MPSGRKRKHTDARLLCEWQGCGAVFDSVDAFFEDVKTHIEQFTSETPGTASDNASPTLSECGWNLCPNFLDRRDVDAVQRHVSFHAHHAKLKCRGQQVLEEAARRVAEDGCNRCCALDSTSRNTIPDLPERLTCQWTGCEYSQNNAEFYYCHVSGHTLDLPGGPKVDEGCRCQWGDCTTVTLNRYKLSEHLRSHTQERTVACPTCGGLFASTTKLIDHVRRQVVPGAQAYRCSHCNKVFPTVRLLRDHIRHHMNIYKCEHCGMTCPHPSGLRAHMLYRHTEGGQHACTHCSHRAKTEADLRKHIEIHNDAGTYYCMEDGCSYITKTSEQFIRHLRTHRQPFAKQFACHVCREVFVRGALLTVHLMTKHNFSWPPGHRRFRYKQDDDGVMRLQTVRFEGMEDGQELGEQSPLPDGEEDEQHLVEVEADEQQLLPMTDTAEAAEEQQLLPMTDTAEAAEEQQLLLLPPLQQQQLLLLQQQLQDGLIVIVGNSDTAGGEGAATASSVDPASPEPSQLQQSQLQPSLLSSNAMGQQQQHGRKKQRSARGSGNRRSGGRRSCGASGATSDCLHQSPSGEH